ncbi:N-acetylglutamate synthase-like GNAT family acetyltransferase [Orenia metallireducens]|uniref:N-acetylglutamate synthase, GNAT family n=2 Tax=Orenia metallireducens TaxID=1413210 RepID=A0A285I6P6_9FIRM|nr:GNAT family N-acetyltransferase [Orenia metallireducens]PRX22466.1 N-acetylglutamate synthase-like GNAT family acetyltransferase [Orenia metallireducens]SNY43604.1 N-acetylglutamate synthase, GNAT family [Orenia metallireducens]
MKIREIRKDDIELVWELIRRNFDEVMINHHSKEIVEKFKEHNKPERLKEQMKWKEIYVVKKDNEIISTGAIANFGDNDSPKYSISNFFVKPELHGQGIGRLMFNHLLISIKKKDIEKLHVPSSRTGLGFYKRMGFVEDEVQPDKKDEIIWMTIELS